MFSSLSSSSFSFSFSFSFFFLLLSSHHIFQASALALELLQFPHHVDASRPLRSRLEEDQQLFHESIHKEADRITNLAPDPETDHAGTLIRLSRFPAAWVSEMNELLYLAIQTCVKPERAESILSMTEAQALELEESLCVKLDVRKASCSFDESTCVVTPLVASMIADYRLNVKPIVARRGYRAPRPEFLRSATMLELVKEAHACWQARSAHPPAHLPAHLPTHPSAHPPVRRSLATKAQDSRKAGKKKWTRVLQILKSKLATREASASAGLPIMTRKLTSAKVSYVYYNGACSQFFRSPANAPLIQINPFKAMLRLGFNEVQAKQATTTLLRSKREQWEFENGGLLSRAYVHSALSHQASTAWNNYTLSATRSLKAKAAHAALSLATCCSSSVRTRLEVLMDLEKEMGRLPFRYDELSVPELEQRLEGCRHLAKRASELPVAVAAIDLELEPAPDSPLIPKGPAQRAPLPVPDFSLLRSNPALWRAPPSPACQQPRPARILWSDADRLELQKGIQKHGNSWSKMARDLDLNFEQLSQFTPEVKQSKLKAYAASKVFKRFEASH